MHTRCCSRDVRRVWRGDRIYRSVRRARFVAPNLLDKGFSATGPNQKWAGDISYIWTGEGWLYLAVVIDLYSRRVIGWAVSESLQNFVP